MDEQTKRLLKISDKTALNRLLTAHGSIDRFIQYTISPWPKKAEECDFCIGVTAHRYLLSGVQKTNLHIAVQYDHTSR